MLEKLTGALKSDNPSFMLNGVEDTEYKDRPIPDVGPNDVLVNVKCTGICGSDIHYLKHGAIGDFVVKEPMCLGHESSGEVVRVGESVKGVAVGDKVAMEPGEVCRRCFYCQKGMYNLCPNIIFAATPPNQLGTLTRYYKLPAENCFKLPAGVTLEDGAMIEPMAVAVHSVSNIGQLKTNEVIVIMGAGPVGLLCMAVAKAIGARRVIGVDINEERLAFAKQYAATDVFQPPPMQPNETKPEYGRRVSDELKAKLGIPEMGPGAIDLLVEATGAEVCILAGMHLLQGGGRFVQVGMGAPNVTIPMFMVMAKELKVQGCFRYGPGSYSMAISLVERGLVDLKPLVTHRYKFKDALEAFRMTEKGKDESGKGVIKCIISGPE